MKSLAFFSAALVLASVVFAADAPKGELIGDPKVLGSLDVAKTGEAGLKATEAAEKIGWRIGSQAYTLRDRSLLEALDTLYMLGLKYVECYPGQAVSPNEFKDAKGKPQTFGPGMSPEAIAAVKKKLDQTGIKVLSMGVTGIPKDEAGARKFFEFCKDFGMERIVTEVHEEQFPVLEKLAENYNIEYEIGPGPELVEKMAKCIDWFGQQCEELSKK